MDAKQIIQQLSGRTILIVGDVMIDRYLTGTVTRISPEAPVPVVLQSGTEDRLGGAANVALNIGALGSTAILCSVVGQDDDAAAFRNLLPSAGLIQDGLVRSGGRRTTVKTRVLGNHQQMLRIDSEDTHPLSDEEATRLLATIHHVLDKHPVEAIILQDYNKGVLSDGVIRQVMDLARKRGLLTTVDPKRNNFFSYKGAGLFKPNLKEIRDSAPFPIDTSLEALQQADRYLREQLGHDKTMITLSDKGLYLDGNLYPTEPRAVADVSGAGDTVISLATLAMAAGLDTGLIARLCNMAGGQVCECSGVVPVQRSLLEMELQAWLEGRS
jgi:rfaE bifunctional protein kinase chain/domain